MVLQHRRDPDDLARHQVIWHPVYADFAAFYGFTPWAHWPYRPQTKGKTESGVKYVQRNALAGRLFRSWEHLNAWLFEWATTIADQRVHGTTHEVPAERFGRLSLFAAAISGVFRWMASLVISELSEPTTAARAPMSASLHAPAETRARNALAATTRSA